jgi:hypothetical protein
LLQDVLILHTLLTSTLTLIFDSIARNNHGKHLLKFADFLRVFALCFAAVVRAFAGVNSAKLAPRAEK